MPGESSSASRSRFSSSSLPALPVHDDLRAGAGRPRALSRSHDRRAGRLDVRPGRLPGRGGAADVRVPRLPDFLPPPLVIPVDHFGRPAVARRARATKRGPTPDAPSRCCLRPLHGGPVTRRAESGRGVVPFSRHRRPGDGERIDLPARAIPSGLAPPRLAAARDGEGPGGDRRPHGREDAERGDRQRSSAHAEHRWRPGNRASRRERCRRRLIHRVGQPRHRGDRGTGGHAPFRVSPGVDEPVRPVLRPGGVRATADPGLPGATGARPRTTLRSGTGFPGGARGSRRDEEQLRRARGARAANPGRRDPRRHRDARSAWNRDRSRAERTARGYPARADGAAQDAGRAVARPLAARRTRGPNRSSTIQGPSTDRGDRQGRGRRAARRGRGRGRRRSRDDRRSGGLRPHSLEPRDERPALRPGAGDRFRRAARRHIASGGRRPGRWRVAGVRAGALRALQQERRCPAEGPGTGLGLAIAQSYAEAHEGKLEYRQAEPHGARFVVVLPEPS